MPLRVGPLSLVGIPRAEARDEGVRLPCAWLPSLGREGSGVSSKKAEAVKSQTCLRQLKM